MLDLKNLDREVDSLIEKITKEDYEAWLAFDENRAKEEIFYPKTAIDTFQGIAPSIPNFPSADIYSVYNYNPSPFPYAAPSHFINWYDIYITPSFAFPTDEFNFAFSNINETVFLPPLENKPEYFPDNSENIAFTEEQSSYMKAA
jgi:hypothetical protein